MLYAPRVTANIPLDEDRENELKKQLAEINSNITLCRQQLGDIDVKLKDVREEIEGAHQRAMMSEKNLKFFKGNNDIINLREYKEQVEIRNRNYDTMRLFQDDLILRLHAQSKLNEVLKQLQEDQQAVTKALAYQAEVIPFLEPKNGKSKRYVTKRS